MFVVSLDFCNFAIERYCKQNAIATMETEGVIRSKGIFLIVKATRDGKPVILKALKSDYKDKSQFQTLLKKEFERFSTLDHPNIAKVLDLIDDEKYGKCLVEEYVDGRSLTDYLNESHSEEEKLAIINQIASALQYAHQKNIMHRNLKASNVLVTKQGDTVKIIDFRLPFADDLHIGYSSMVHVSPEQKDGTVAIDARADIYSLGVLLKGFALPSDYDHVIEKCCSYNRGDRYIDVDSFLQDLEGGSSAGSTKKPWIIGLIAVVVIVAAIIIFSQMKSGSTDSNEPAQTEQKDSMQNAGTQDQQQTAAPAPTAQPDSTQAAPQAAQAAAGAKFNDQVKAQMCADMDKMYQPYLDGTATDKGALRKQLRNYYKGLKRQLGALSNEDQAAFDNAYIQYKSQKDAQLK